MTFEELHFAFVLFGLLARFKCAEVAALTGPRILFSGVESVFAGFQFSNHARVPLHS
jgi:hypothetical protein